MIRIEIKSNPSNLHPVADLLHNRWVFMNDFVFVVVTPRFRERFTVPAKSASTKKLRPRRARAELVWEGLKALRRSELRPISWKEADDAYLSVLKADGCHPAWVAFRRLELYCNGVLDELWQYWTPVKPLEPPKPPEDPPED